MTASEILAAGLRIIPCPQCDGSGSETGPDVPGFACPRCGGAGEIHNPDILAMAEDFNQQRVSLGKINASLREAIARAEQRELAALAELDEARALLRKRHGMECPTYDDATGTCQGCEVSEFLDGCVRDFRGIHLSTAPAVEWKGGGLPTPEDVDRGLAAELAELERANPEVRKAAENYDRVRAEIIGREIDPHWYTHELVDGRWEHLYDAYWNHQASGAKTPRRGMATDAMLCDCATNRARPYGPAPEPGCR